MWRTRNTPREEQTRIVSNTVGGRLLVRKKENGGKRLTSLRRDISDCSLCAMCERSVTKCVMAGLGPLGSGSGVSVWLGLP